MNALRLVPMSADIAREAYECIRDLPPENGFRCVAYGHSWEEFLAADVPGMIASATGENVPPGRVPQAYWFLFDGDTAVGLFKVRPVLSDALREGSGHIGYGICRSCRGKGYATAGLALAVEMLRPVVAEDEVYMYVNKDNPASLRVMLRNGAYIYHEDGDGYCTRIPLRLRLDPISPDNADAIYDCMQDIPPENGFTNEDYGCTPEYFAKEAIPRMMAWAKGENLPQGYVPETFFILWDGETAVGMFRVRHHLTDALRETAGHIGYAIRRSERGKGYGKRGLALTIQAARRIVPEDTLYLRLERTNPASLRVMLANGATIHHENDGHIYTRISLKKRVDTANLRLVPVSTDIAKAAYDCLRDLQPENGFQNGYRDHSWEQFVSEDIPRMEAMAAGIGLRPEHVQQTSYILMDGDVGVGLFKLRHYLNDGLRDGAGHIGYAIRRDRQGRGYATTGLALAVEEARHVIPEDEVYMSVNKANPASLRVMLKNGAYIHHESEDHVYTRIPLRRSNEP